MIEDCPVRRHGTRWVFGNFRRIKGS